MPPDWVNVPGLGTTTPDAIVSVPLGRAIVPVNVLPVSRSKLPELNSTTPLEPAKVPLWPAAPSPCVSCSVPALARTWLPGVVSSNTPMAVALVPVELRVRVPWTRRLPPAPPLRSASDWKSSVPLAATSIAPPLLTSMLEPMFVVVIAPAPSIRSVRPLRATNEVPARVKVASAVIRVTPLPTGPSPCVPELQR